MGVRWSTMARSRRYAPSALSRLSAIACAVALAGSGCADDGDEASDDTETEGTDDSTSGTDGPLDTDGDGESGTTTEGTGTTGDGIIPGPLTIDVDLEFEPMPVPEGAYAILAITATPRDAGSPVVAGETRVEPLDSLRIPVQIELEDGFDPSFLYRFAIRGRADGTPDEESECSDFAIDRNVTPELEDPEAFAVVFALVRDPFCEAGG